MSTFRTVFFSILTLFILTTASAQQRVEIYYLNGTIKQEGSVVNGLKDGRWTDYREDGVRFKESEYSTGKLTSEVFYGETRSKEKSVTHNPESGQILYKQFTSNGMTKSLSNIDPDLIIQPSKIEPSTSYFANFCDQYGTFEKSWIHDPNGSGTALPHHEFHSRSKLKSVRCGTNYISWQRFSGVDSLCGYFDSSEKNYALKWPERGISDDAEVRAFNTQLAESKLKSFFMSGLPYGDWSNYYPNGQLWYAISYKDGMPQGPYQAFYHDGQKMMNCRFDKGRMDGECSEWHPNGQQRYLGKYVLGKQVGLWTFWNEAGAVEQEQEFDEKGDLHIDKKFFANGKLKSELLGCRGGICASSSKYFDSGILKKRMAYGQLEKNDEKGNGRSFTPIIGPRIEYSSAGRPRSMAYQNTQSGAGFKISFSEKGSAQEATYYYSKTDSIHAQYDESGGVTISAFDNKAYNSKPAISMLKSVKKMGELETGERQLGQRHGVWTTFYPNGKKWMEATYMNGLPDGPMTVWSAEGKKLESMICIKGRPDGAHESWTHAGKKVVSSGYSEGLLSGQRKVWHPRTGELKSTATFVDGRSTGERSRFNKNGALIEQCQYKNDLRDGKCTIFNADGKANGFKTFRAGLLHGPLELKGVNGTSKQKGQYAHGLQSGEWIIDGEAVTFVAGREYVEADSDRCRFNLDNPLASDMPSLPALQESFSFENLQDWTNDRLSISANQFAGLHRGEQSLKKDKTVIPLVTDQDLTLTSTDLKGFGFDLNPMTVRGEYSSIGLEYKKVDHFLQHNPRFSEGQFKGTALDYYHLGLDHYNMDARSVIDMGRDHVMTQKGVEQDSAYARIYSQLLADKVVPKIPDPEAGSVASWALADKDEEVRQSVFMQLGVSSSNSTQQQDLDLIDSFFSALAGPHFVQNIDKKVTQYTVDLRPSAMAIVMPPFQITDKRNDLNKGARLNMDINMLRYNTDQGLSIISPEAFCFAEGYVGGSPFSVDFDKPEIVIRPRKLRELIPNTQDYYFYAENLGLEFSGIFVPEAWGRFTTESGEQIFLEYFNIGITEKFFAGRLLIKLPEEHNHEVFRYMEETFTYHEIISEWSGVLEIYFMRLKPKDE